MDAISLYQVDIKRCNTVVFVGHFMITMRKVTNQPIDVSLTGRSPTRKLNLYPLNVNFTQFLTVDKSLIQPKGQSSI